MPKPTFFTPAALSADSVLESTGVGTLSTQKNPRSSSALTTVDLPAPLTPVTTTTSGRDSGRLLVRSLIAADPARPPEGEPSFRWGRSEAAAANARSAAPTPAGRAAHSRAAARSLAPSGVQPDGVTRRARR